MDAPKIISAIEYNNKIFKVGDIVNYTKDTGFSERKGTGRLKRIGTKNIEFDTSEIFNGQLDILDINDVKSISHAAEQEE